MRMKWSEPFLEHHYFSMPALITTSAPAALSLLAFFSSLMPWHFFPKPCIYLQPQQHGCGRDVLEDEIPSQKHPRGFTTLNSLSWDKPCGQQTFNNEPFGHLELGLVFYEREIVFAHFPFSMDRDYFYPMGTNPRPWVTKLIPISC